MKFLLSLFSTLSLLSSDFILPNEITMTEECAIYLTSAPPLKQVIFGRKTASSPITIGRNTMTYYPSFGGSDLVLSGTTENLGECGFNKRPDFNIVNADYEFAWSFSKINFSQDMKTGVFTISDGTPSDAVYRVYVFKAEKVDGKWQVTKIASFDRVL